MNISTLLGITIGVLTLVVGLMLKGAKVSVLINPAALVIIFVGTFAALLNAFPMKSIAKIPIFFGLLIKGNNLPEMVDIAREIVEMGQQARKNGILSLENVQLKDPFMASAVGMMVDGVEPGRLEDLLQAKVEETQERHKLGALIFSQAGTYAPTLGVLGAVMGLISALGNLNNIDALGHSIAAAFIATLFGIFTGYVLWHPFANKLKRMSLEEIEVKRMIITGILSIQSGEAPFVTQERMLAYIPENQRQILENEWRS